MPADAICCRTLCVGRSQFPLQIRLRGHMAQHAAPPVFQPAKHAAEDDRIDAFQLAAQPRLERNLACRPPASADTASCGRTGCSLPRPLRARNGANDSTSMNTGVTPRNCTLYARGIFQYPVMPQRAIQDLQVQQRRVAQHRESPFVGIAEEGNAFMLEHKRAGGKRAAPPISPAPLRACRTSRPADCNSSPGRTTRTGASAPPRRKNHAENPLAVPDDVSVRVAKRTAIALEVRSQQIRLHCAYDLPPGLLFLRRDGWNFAGRLRRFGL